MRGSVLALCGLLCGCAPRAPAAPRPAAGVEPIVIGHSFVLDSAALHERRRITVYLPPGHATSDARYPVLYLLDGGAAEDFHHITGIVQVSLANETMAPVIVVGVENTERRRDLTGPTTRAEDRAIAPRVGGSAAFRAFLVDELVPRIERDYRASDARALIGESLAGLFVVETFFAQPGPFRWFIAVSPSLWWNGEALLEQAAARLKALPVAGKTLYLTVGGVEDSTAETKRLADLLAAGAPAGLTWFYEPEASESHRSIFHIGALRALRRIFPAALPGEAAGVSLGR